MFATLQYIRSSLKPVIIEQGIEKRASFDEKNVHCFPYKRGNPCLFQGQEWVPGLALVPPFSICRVPKKVMSSLHTTGVQEKFGPRKILKQLLDTLFGKAVIFSVQDLKQNPRIPKVLLPGSCRTKWGTFFGTQRNLLRLRTSSQKRHGDGMKASRKFGDLLP